MTETPEIPEAAIRAAAEMAHERGLYDHKWGDPVCIDDEGPYGPSCKQRCLHDGAAVLAAALPHLNPEPTFTASEVKELTTKAAEVALALGRKEAAEEAVIIVAAHWPTRTRGGYGLECCLDDVRDLILRPRDAGSQPSLAVSNDLTAPTGHSDLPLAPEAVRSLPEGRDQ